MQECLLSLRRFLELTGLYSLWLIIISGLQMRKWSFVGRLGMGSDCCCEEWGHRVRAWRRAAFSFQVFSAVKNENKESSTVWKLNPCWVCLFLRVEKLYLCSIFSPCVFLCLCVATEDSILLLLTLVVFLPLELLFIYYKATILWRCSQHLHSINNPESVMPSKRQYLLNSAHTTRRQNHSIWFLTLLTHLYILFLFNNIRQLLESKQALPLINLFLSLPLCLWEINKGDVLHAETFQGNKISLNNHKRRMWIQSTKVYRTSNKLNILLKASHFDHTATFFPSNYSQTDKLLT